MARPFGTKDIKSPDEFLELFEEYEKGLETLSLEVVHPKLGKITLDTRSPMTMEGFCRFGYDKGVTIHNYVDNPDNKYAEYVEVIKYLKYKIYEANFNRAAVGIYKEALISKQLGLSEKITQTNIEQPFFPDEKK